VGIKILVFPMHLYTLTNSRHAQKAEENAIDNQEKNPRRTQSVLQRSILANLAQSFEIFKLCGYPHSCCAIPFPCCIKSNFPCFAFILLQFLQEKTMHLMNQQKYQSKPPQRPSSSHAMEVVIA
jgi:hypothetical protein